MNEPSLHHLERDVEAARAKLESDLSILRAPSTSSEFTAAMKDEALEAKDLFIEKAKVRMQSGVKSIAEDLMARAAANPLAVLAIGAGIAWRMIRRPPIATALVGAGLASLLQTPPARPNGHAPADYLEHAKNRLLGQASNAGDRIKNEALELGDVAADKATELAGSTKEFVEQWSATARQTATDTTNQVRRTAAEAAEKVRQSVPGDELLRTYGAGEWSRSSGQALLGQEPRDQLLLGVAGVAVVAALSIACQRRLNGVPVE